jgi:uncharacterized protein (UPF0332 family)
MNDKDRKDLIRYRISKAKDTFKEVEFLVQSEYWNTAVNRLYYACYYAVIALLLSKEIKATTHAGVRQMFGLHFIKTEKLDKELGKFYSDIFDMRQSGDYGDYIEFSREDVLDLLSPAKNLITSIEEMLNAD